MDDDNAPLPRTPDCINGPRVSPKQDSQDDQGLQRQLRNATGQARGDVPDRVQDRGRHEATLDGDRLDGARLNPHDYTELGSERDAFVDDFVDEFGTGTKRAGDAGPEEATPGDEDENPGAEGSDLDDEDQVRDDQHRDGGQTPDEQDSDASGSSGGRVPAEGLDSDGDASDYSIGQGVGAAGSHDEEVPGLRQRRPARNVCGRNVCGAQGGLGLPGVGLPGAGTERWWLNLLRLCLESLVEYVRSLIFSAPGRDLVRELSVAFESGLELAGSMTAARERDLPVLVVLVHGSRAGSAVAHVCALAETLRPRFLVHVAQSPMADLTADVDLRPATTGGELLSFVGLLPYEFDVSSLHLGGGGNMTHSGTSNTMGGGNMVQSRGGRRRYTTAANRLPLDAETQQELFVKILQHSFTPEIRTPHNLDPTLLPRHAILRGFLLALTTNTPLDNLRTDLSRLAVYLNNLMEPVRQELRTHADTIQQNRLLREQQQREYRQALQADRERRRQQQELEEKQKEKELEKARQVELEKVAEERRRATAAQLVRNAEAGALVQRWRKGEEFVELAIRVRGLGRLLCMCDKHTGLANLEAALRLLDHLITLSREEVAENPLLIVGTRVTDHDEIAHDEIAHDEIAHDEIAHDNVDADPSLRSLAAVVVEGGFPWQRSAAGHCLHLESYGIVAPLPDQPLQRSQTLDQNGITTKSTMLWGPKADGCGTEQI
ncbi:hypothetical protein GNI_157080 [Gregarina niphandrodes]|uniref:Uncharacterized protein n=1 Tax=Gregarina niphandrodes TaxID=110365 RepID=A0A023AZG5_GRENI|nr:hypothetical protein GNI_157080 [Gregarina niphandrodes]EZG43868.1 hypothetical protein GNI_157080 [Gregarina niphandrodes]|eukprot:XP_011132956.1 hypothetical protein GNI_157080 [Gregarina niphandrodes]